MSDLLPEFSIFRNECMPSHDVPIPTAKELTLKSLLAEIKQNESYVMEVGALCSSLEACLATMQYVLAVAKFAMERKHTSLACRRSIREMRKAMKALRAM